MVLGRKEERRAEERRFGTKMANMLKYYWVKYVYNLLVLLQGQGGWACCSEMSVILFQLHTDEGKHTHAHSHTYTHTRARAAAHTRTMHAHT